MDVKFSNFLVLCFVVVFIQVIKPDEEISDKVLATRRQMECMEELRVDPYLVVKVKNGDWSEGSPLLKQWVLCVLMKAGLMTREGVYRLDVAMDKAPEKHKNEIEAMINKCLSRKAIPAPHIAYNFAKCYHHRAKGNFTFASIF